jgi:ribosomal protein L40E
MIVCPNCNHQNPDGATQCEACYTPLPATTTCPNCGSTVQTDASFCGQCGFNLLNAGAPIGAAMTSAPNSIPDDIPDLVPPEPLVAPDPMSISSQPNVEPGYTSPPTSNPVTPLPATVVSQPMISEAENESSPDLGTLPPSLTPVASQSAASAGTPSSPPPPPISTPGVARTQLQVQSAYLLHIQTNTKVELPSNLSVIHMGKPNDQIPPDIDVSGYPNSEIVSRVHADIRVEGDTYYIEDVGSSNGTYINHTPLPKGNRHRLRSGDRISLGKGDQVTFLFEST